MSVAPPLKLVSRLPSSLQEVLLHALMFDTDRIHYVIACLPSVLGKDLMVFGIVIVVGRKVSDVPSSDRLAGTIVSNVRNI